MSTCQLSDEDGVPLTQPHIHRDDRDGDDHVEIQDMSARYIISHDSECDGLVNKFVDYWTSHLPDLSDYPDIPPEKIQFWRRKKRSEKFNKHKRKREHVTLKGLDSKWVNVVGVRVHGLIPCTSFSRHNPCALTLIMFAELSCFHVDM